MAVKRIPGATGQPILPTGGFRDSKPRSMVSLSEMTAASKDWLVTKWGLLRRAGSAIFGDTLAAGVEVTGILESKWSAKARRLYSATLASMVDGYPSVMGLFTAESTKRATLAFRSTNGTDSWRTVGKEWSTTHYPDASVPTFRCVPLLYENTYGGVTLHRLNSATHRAYLCAGSRDVQQVGSWVVAPSLYGVPVKWNTRFNDATGSGTEECEVYPLGLMMPLQMPTITTGNNLGGTVGPWKGSDAFFYACLGETHDGELGFFTIPRPAGSAWSGYPGFGYCLVDGANPTDYFDSVVVSGIPVLPPEFKWVRVLRSSKVDVAASSGVLFPAVDDLQFWFKVENGTTSYTDSNGNDLSLNPDPRIGEMFREPGGLVWPPRARYMGGFDGHLTLGYLRQNPGALVIAPWANGTRNAKADDASLYASPYYFVAVTATDLVLRKVTTTGTGSNVTKVGATVNASTIIGVPNTTSVVIGNKVTGTGIKSIAGGYPSDTYVSDIAPLVVTGAVTVSGNSTVTMDTTGARTGQGISGSGIPASTTVSSITDPTHLVMSANATASATVDVQLEQVTLTQAATATNNGITFTFATGAIDTSLALTDYTLRALCDHVNADASVVTVSHAAQFTAARNFISTFYSAEAVTDVAVGDYVLDSSLAASQFPAGTRVTSVDTTNKLVYCDQNALYTVGGTSTETVIFKRPSEGVSVEWGVQVVPGADADTTADNLLRTRVLATSSTFGNADTTLTVPSSVLPYIQPGMLVAIADGSPVAPFSAGTVVTAVDTAAGSNQVTISPATVDSDGGAGRTVEFHYDTGDNTLAQGRGFVRTFSNSFPCVLYFSPTYLEQFPTKKQDSIFTAASPGYAQNGVNTWMVSNRRPAPASFGPHMGFADFGPVLLEFYARGRMRLVNPRTGSTHVDADYNKEVTSWSRGARSPYSICSGNGWAIALSDEGLFGFGLGIGEEVMLSEAIYDPTAPVGKRGQLEYAIGKCVAASEGDTDDYALFAQVHGSVLRVRYCSSASATYPDREIRYDFSQSVGRSGLAQLLQPDGRPYPWSAPLTLRVSSSAEVGTASGMVLYGARDSNGGTADGRVDTLDTGTEDNGAMVLPVAYSGVLVPEVPVARQPLRVRAHYRKAGAGIKVGISRNPEWDETATEWDDVAMPSSGGDDYARAVEPFEGSVRLQRKAEQYRITDDGSGPCPEVVRVVVEMEPQEDVT